MINFAAASVLTGAVGSLVKAYTGDMSDAMRNSLTSFVKPTMLTSRVYIDEAVSHLDVTTDTMKVLHSLYCTMIINALRLNEFVRHGKTVRDVLNVVATEHMQPHVSLESALIEWETGKPASLRLAVSMESDTPSAGDIRIAGEKELGSSSQPVPIGKVIEIVFDANGIIRLPDKTHHSSGPAGYGNLANPGGSNDPDKDKEKEKVSMKLNLHVQILPFIIPAQLASKFLNKDFIPSFRQRWSQLTSGEISFFGDFLMKSDLHELQRQIMTNDSTGMFWREIESRLDKGRRTAGNLVRNSHERARNIANSIVMLSNDAVARARLESGINLHDRHDRDKFFFHTFTMIIVVIDPVYNRVTMYLNGFDDGWTYTFDQMKTGAKNNSAGGAGDLISLLKSLSEGKAPRF